MAKAKRKPAPKRNGSTNGAVLKRSKAILQRPIITGVEASPPFIPVDLRASVITPERVEWWKRSRFAPIRTLSPEMLSRQLDDFAAGLMRQFALTMDAIEQRDDKLVSVIPKRKAALKRHEYEILLDSKYEDDPEAEKHKEVLEYFWSHVEASNAVDQNQRGAFSMLVEQMMDAIAKKYAVHEILWRPELDGLTATFNFVPLWFFENLRGRLAFLKADLDYYGVPLDDGAWMITCGPGLMVACSIAYMFKRLPMQDWLRYCEKHGMPGILGKTDAAHGSTQWNALKDAVTAVSADFSAIINKVDEIDTVTFAADGQLPYGPLVDRMDRAIVEIWLGGDLATMSHQGTGQGTGASLQEQQSDQLEQDDAKFISQTLNMQVERKIIEYHFGPGVLPKAYLSIVIPEKQDTTKELAVDQFLVDHGAPISIPDAMERYGRSQPKDNEPILEKPEPPGMNSPNGGGGPSGGSRGRNSARPAKKPTARFSANEARNAEYSRAILEQAADDLAQAQSETLAPLRHRLEGILEMPNEETFRAAVARLRRDLPGILEEVNQDPANAEPIAAAMASFFFNKLAEGAVRKHQPRSMTEAELRSYANEIVEEFCNDGGNCGTGAGGFQPGNTCGKGGGPGNSMAELDAVSQAQLKTALEKADIAAIAKKHGADPDKVVKALGLEPKAKLSETGAVPPLVKTETVDTSNWPAHNTAAKWGANKIALMENLAKNGEWAKLKEMDTVPKSVQPNKYQKAVHEAWGKLSAQQGQIPAAPALTGETPKTGHHAAEINTAQTAIALQPKNPGQEGQPVGPKVPPPPQVQTKANPGAQPKLNSIHAAALTGQITAVESIYTNPETKNIYGKKAHDYKMQVLAAMKAGGKAEVADAPKVAAPANWPEHLSKLKTEASSQLKIGDLPPTPEFLSKSAVQVAENQKAIAHMKTLALSGKFDELKALPESPSPKVNQFKQGILGAIHEKLNPPLPDTSVSKFTGAITELDKHAPVVKDVTAGYKVGYYVIAGQPGVFYHPYGGGKQATSQTLSSLKHYEAFTNLTAQEQKLIKSHTGSGYGKFNPKYWQGVPGTDEEALSKALLKASQPLPEGTLLHRKINVDSSVIAKLKYSVGKVIQEPANASTSINASTWHGNVHLHIISGPGAKGLYVGQVHGKALAISSNPGENEVLLPANTRMLVQKVVMSGPNAADVHVLMLPTVAHQAVEAKNKTPKKHQMGAGGLTHSEAKAQGLHPDPNA